MYKNLISSVIEKRQAISEAEKFDRMIKTRIKNTKYSVKDIYISNIVSQINTNGGVLNQAVSSDLRLLRRVSKNKFQDIETLKFYPLVEINQKPNGVNYYISERFLDKVTYEYIDVLSDLNIQDEDMLTASEFRNVVNSKQYIV